MAPGSVLPKAEPAKPGFVFRAQDPAHPAKGTEQGPGSPAKKPLFNASQALAIGARAQAATTTPSTTTGSTMHRSHTPQFTFANLDNASPAPSARGSPAQQSPASSIFTTPSRSPFASPSPSTARSPQSTGNEAKNPFRLAHVPTVTQATPFQFGAGPTSPSPSQKPQASRGGGLFSGGVGTSMPTAKRPDAPSAAPRPAASLFGGGIPSNTEFLFGQQQQEKKTPDPSIVLTGRLGNLSLDQGTPSPVPAASQTPAPYKVSDEQPPPHEFFTFAVQSALTIGRGIALDVTNALDRVRQDSLADQDSHRLRDEAFKLSQWKATGSCKIAVLGDSGQGKSSLINSLLHVPGIAQTSDMGAACTSVVTEYHAKRLGQESPIAIEVEYLSGAALEELVRELAWSYRQFYLPDVQSPAGLISDEEYAKCERESDQAWSALESAFQHHRGFSAEFLRDQSDGAKDRVNARLIQWAREIKWPAGGRTTASGACIWHSNAQDADEACEMSKVFMEDGLWPFTKIILVYLSSQVLKGGVVLADLPGLQDTNLARVKTTQDYLLKCDNILIVSRISRAITDHSLKSSLFSAVARHVPTEWEESGGSKLNLAVVCTGAEDIDTKKATAEFCGQGKRISREEMRKLEADIQAAKGDHAKKKAAKRKLEFALINARNAHVTEALRKRYSKDTGGNLEVFCIANKAYEKFSRKGNTDFVRASGVPALRRFCHGITADAQMRETRHFLRSLLPGLLNSVDLWASSHVPHAGFSEADKANMARHLDKIQKEVPKYVNELRGSFIDSFQEQIMCFLGHREGKWKDAAVKEASEWNSWRWNSYKAWCRNNGNYSTKTHGAVDWNSKIVWKMRMELEFQWEILEDEVPAVFKKLSDDVSQQFARLMQDSIMRAAQTAQRDLLVQAINNLDEAWKYNITFHEQQAARSLAHIRKQASESNETSYVFKEMLESYRAAASDSGPGTDRRQKDIVNGHIGGEMLFPNIAVRMSTDMLALAQSTEQTAGQLVKEIMSKLEQHVRLALREGAHAGGAYVGGAQNSVTQLKKVVDAQKGKLGGVARV